MFKINKKQKKVEDTDDDVTGVLSLEVPELLEEASKIHGKLARQISILADIKEDYMLASAAVKAEHATLYAKYHKELDKPTKDLILAKVESSESYNKLITEKIKRETLVNKQKAIVEALSKKIKMISSMLYPLSEEYKQAIRHTSFVQCVPDEYVLED